MTKVTFVNNWEIRHKLQNKKQCHSWGQELKTSPAVCVKSSREWTVGAPAGYCWGGSFLPIWQQDHNHQTQYPHRPTTTHSTHTGPQPHRTTTTHSTHNHNPPVHQSTRLTHTPTSSPHTHHQIDTFTWCRNIGSVIITKCTRLLVLEIITYIEEVCYEFL